MFGKPDQKGLERLPLYSQHVVGGVSWERKCRDLARNVRKQLGIIIAVDACWMHKELNFTYQMKGKGLQMSVMIVRLLAYRTKDLLCSASTRTQGKKDSLSTKLTTYQQSDIL